MMGKNDIPELTDEQRRENVRKAKEMRIERGALRRRIERGELSVSDVIAMDTQAAQRMRVYHLLCSIPHVGRAKAQKLMEEMHVSPSRRVMGLGSRQRAALVEKFG